MKRKYQFPKFCAENYFINASIATCDIHIGDNVETDPITIEYKKTHLCTNPQCAHTAGGNPNNAVHQGNIPKEKYALTLFNDGIDGKACQFDWAGGNVTGPDGTSYEDFGTAFYGAKANSDKNHRPAYDNKVFFS